MTEEISKLLLIQSELKAPKNQWNKFGKYNFRSCEDILEAVKPLLLKHNCILVLSDEIQVYGDRVYVCASAMLTEEDGKRTDVVAYAREPESKKGMDTSQITGAASSYARKYALNGLFLIDDTKDADSQKPEKVTVKKSSLTAKMIDDYFDGYTIGGEYIMINGDKIKLTPEQLGKLKQHERYKGDMEGSEGI